MERASRNRALRGPLLAGLWLLLSPVAAAACPACYESSSSSVLLTYYLSTIMLTVLPFAIIGTVVTVALYLGRQMGESAPATDSPVLPEHTSG